MTSECISPSTDRVKITEKGNVLYGFVASKQQSIRPPALFCGGMLLRPQAVESPQVVLMALTTEADMIRKA